MYIRKFWSEAEREAVLSNCYRPKRKRSKGQGKKHYGWVKTTRDALNKQSRTEELFSRLLQKHGIYAERNRFFEIDWQTKYFVDFYFPRHALVVELDGPSHDGKESEDAQRDKELKQVLKLTVVRFKNQEVWKERDGLITRLFPSAAPVAVKEG